MGQPVRVQVSPRAPLLSRVRKQLRARLSHLSVFLCRPDTERGSRGLRCKSSERQSPERRERVILGADSRTRLLKNRLNLRFCGRPPRAEPQATHERRR